MVSDKLYRRMQLGCSCGHVSSNMSEEARHRHNFPLLCRKPARRCVVATNEVETPGSETADGLPRLRQCKRTTRDGTDFCWQHKKYMAGCAAED